MTAIVYQRAIFLTQLEANVKKLVKFHRIDLSKVRAFEAAERWKHLQELLRLLTLPLALFVGVALFLEPLRLCFGLAKSSSEYTASLCCWPSVATALLSWSLYSSSAFGKDNVVEYVV